MIDKAVVQIIVKHIRLLTFTTPTVYDSRNKAGSEKQVLFGQSGFSSLRKLKSS